MPVSELPGEDMRLAILQSRMMAFACGAGHSTPSGAWRVRWTGGVSGGRQVVWVGVWLGGQVMVGWVGWWIGKWLV